jgi:hypothetical protein
VKSDRVKVRNPDLGDEVPHFHPRLQRWGEHFAWDGYYLRPLSAIAAATIATLDLNHPRRIRIRQAEELFGLFPPEDG